MIMSEHDEITNHLINEDIGNIFKTYGTNGHLNEVHITDL